MGGRRSNGQFANGNPGGPGRPRRPVETDYLKALSEACPPETWREIVNRAVRDAVAGDPQARAWLSKYLLGDATLIGTLTTSEKLALLTEDV